MDTELELLIERVNDLENEIVRLRNELIPQKELSKAPKNSLVNSLIPGIFKGAMLLITSKATVQQQLLNYQSWYSNNQAVTQLVLTAIPKISSIKSLNKE